MYTTAPTRVKSRACEASSRGAASPGGCSSAPPRVPTRGRDRAPPCRGAPAEPRRVGNTALTLICSWPLLVFSMKKRKKKNETVIILFICTALYMKSDARPPRPPAALPPLRPFPQPAPRHAGSRAVPAASCSPAAGPGRAPHAATTAHKRGTAPPGTAPPPLPAPPGPSRSLPAPPGPSRPLPPRRTHEPPP